MKSHTRLLASLLIISTIASATGCSKTNETKGNVTEPIVLEYDQKNHIIAEEIVEFISPIPTEEVIVENIPTIIDEVNEPMNVSSDEEKSIEELLSECLYDESIDYKLVIKNYLNNYENRAEIKDDYLRAVYMLLLNTNVPMEIYLKELHIMTLMQQIPMCVPESIWYSSFGNLIAVDPECISLFDMFSEFAIYVHSLECNDNHTLNDFDCFTCPSLEEEYTRKLTIKDI